MFSVKICKIEEVLEQWFHWLNINKSFIEKATMLEKRTKILQTLETKGEEPARSNGKQPLLWPLLLKNTYTTVYFLLISHSSRGKFGKIMSKCLPDKCSRVLNLTFSRNWFFHENHHILGYHTISTVEGREGMEQIMQSNALPLSYTPLHTTPQGSFYSWPGCES